MLVCIKIGKHLDETFDTSPGHEVLLAHVRKKCKNKSAASSDSAPPYSNFEAKPKRQGLYVYANAPDMTEMSKTVFNKMK